MLCFALRCFRNLKLLEVVVSSGDVVAADKCERKLDSNTCLSLDPETFGLVSEPEHPTSTKYAPDSEADHLYTRLKSKAIRYCGCTS